MNICVNCEHYRRDEYTPYDSTITFVTGKCTRRHATKSIDPVNGDKTTRENELVCSTERHAKGTIFNGLCGKQGRHFKQTTK